MAMKIDPTFSSTPTLNLTREESEHIFNNFSMVFPRKRGISDIGIILEILQGIISFELHYIYPHKKQQQQRKNNNKKNQG